MRSSICFCTDPSREPSKLAAIRSASCSSPDSSAFAEALAQLAGVALELGAHVVDLSSRALALEHARTDLDRVANGLRRGVAAGMALAYDAGGPLVLDCERVDHEPVVGQADVPVTGLVKRKLWSL